MPEKYRRPHSHERVQAVERMRRRQREQDEALDAVLRFNAVTSTGGRIWSWPTVAAALVSKHHWLVVACEACDTVVDLDLRVKRRDPDASVRVALRDVRCPRCNGHGRPRVVGWRSIRRFNEGQGCALGRQHGGRIAAMIFF